MATANRLTTINHNEPGYNPLDPPTYVSARVLAAGVAESITIPQGSAGAGTVAQYVRIAGNADIYYSFSGAAAVPAADVDDGTASEMIPNACGGQWRKIPPTATLLSVVCAGAAIVTAAFYVA